MVICDWSHSGLICSHRSCSELLHLEQNSVSIYCYTDCFIKDQKSVETNIHLDIIYQDILKFIRTYEAAEEILMSGECLLTGAEQLH